MGFKNLPRPNAKALAWQLTSFSAFKVNIAALKAPIPIKEVPMFKLTIEDDLQSDYQLIKVKFTSLKPMKFVYVLEHPTDNQHA